MPVIMTLAGLPSTLGATIIQSNAVLLPAGEYTQIDWYAAQRIVTETGRNLYMEFPNGNTPNPAWQFFTRVDMTGVSSSQKTLIAVVRRSVFGPRKALNTTTMTYGEFPTIRKRIDIHAYHLVNSTLTNGSSYTDISLSKVGVTLFIDPETGQIIMPTNGYQAVHEALGLVLKPVAAGAPIWDPAYAAQAGINPNV